jgi:23S rRNA pseudouridine2604 synthase
LLRCSHETADQLCREGQIRVDGVVETDPRKTVEAHQEIRLGDQMLRQGLRRKYLLFYKPVGFECTANRNIEAHMYQLLPPEYQDFFPLGRLDLNSEGLLLLTNDGQTYKKWMEREAGIEKEYWVETWHPVTDGLVRAFEEPFLLGKRFTLPARFEKRGEFEFSVVLQEGINRQIRRICAKNQNQVKRLLRVRFGQMVLGQMQPGDLVEVPSFG